MKLIRTLLLVSLLLILSAVAFYLFKGRSQPARHVEIIDVEDKGVQLGFYYEELEGGRKKYIVSASKFREGERGKVWLQNGVRIEILSKDPVYISSADGQVWRRQKIYKLTGGVEVRSRDMTFFTTSLTYLPAQHRLEAPGFASWETPEALGTGRNIVYHLKQKRLVIRDGGRIILKKEETSIKARYIEYVGRRGWGIARGEVIVTHAGSYFQAENMFFFLKEGQVEKLEGRVDCRAFFGEEKKVTADRLIVAFGEYAGFKADGNAYLLDKREKIELTADYIAAREGYLYAKGNVDISAKGYRVKAAELEMKEGVAEFKGKVKIEGKGLKAECRRAFLKEKEVVLDQALVHTEEGWFRCRKLEKKGERLVAEGGIKGRFKKRSFIRKSSLPVIFVSHRLEKDSDVITLRGKVLLVQGKDMLAAERVRMEGEKLEAWKVQLRSQSERNFTVRADYAVIEKNLFTFRGKVKMKGDKFSIEASSAVLHSDGEKITLLEASSCRRISVDGSRGRADEFTFDFSKDVAILKGKAVFTDKRGTTSGQLLRYYLKEKKLEVLTEGGRTESEYRGKGA